MPGDSQRFDRYGGQADSLILDQKVRRIKNERVSKSEPYKVELQIPCGFHCQEEKEGAVKHLGKLFHELARQKGCEIVEGHLMADYVHRCMSIPPKYSVANVVGFIKGKSAISIARNFRGKTKNFTAENFWARGYFVTTVGLDEEIVRNYIRKPETEDQQYEQLSLFES